MKKAAAIVAAIESTSSYNDKLSILENHKDNELFKDIMKFIYNPYCKTGISTAKLNKALYEEHVGTVAPYLDITEALEYFKSHNTGSNEDLAAAREFIRLCAVKYGKQAAELAKAIVTQDLKIGITATSLNKVYGANFIPRTGCMLGTPFEDAVHKVSGPYIVTEKLDGVRRVLIKENGTCRLYSRSGHEDTGLVEIVEDAKLLPDNFVYDGELLADGDFDNSIALRQATNSIANTKGRKTGLTFNVFDMVPLNDFLNGRCNIPAKDRKIRLAATFNDHSLSTIDKDWAQRCAAFSMYDETPFIKSVPILGSVYTLEELEPIVEEIWCRGGEGVMLNTVDGPYEIKRSKHLLKVKHTEELVLTVVGFAEGRGKNEDSLGAIIVKYKNSHVCVGSGFTDAQRKLIWENQSYFVGRKAEIETFGESTNMNGDISLNCPIFKRFVGDE